MEVCARCGKPGHGSNACPVPAGSMPPPGFPSRPPAPYASIPTPGYSSMPPPGYSSMPPPGRSSMPPPGRSSMPPPGGANGSMPPSGAFSLSGAYAASQNPVHRTLRLLKTQLNLAIGQREEDPERAWLEAVSVRDRLEQLLVNSREDQLLFSDVDRFRTKLTEQLRKLTRDIGDDIVAPLYSWMDLLRQRERLDVEVETARQRVAEARASRGAPTVPPLAPPLTTVEEATAALESIEGELAVWRRDAPPLPSPEALALWNEAGGDALRAKLPAEPEVVRARGVAAQAFVLSEGARGGAAGYAGSRMELIVLPTTGASALLSSMFAFSVQGTHLPLSILAVLACGSFGAAAMASVQARRRIYLERRATLDLVWSHKQTTEQSAALELELGWLRTLVAALRARRAFDAHKGEGGQLADLAKWRPDLLEVVADVARSSLGPPAF